MTKQLSPAAEAVLNAATEAQYGSCYTQFERISSAALRAAADQAVPEEAPEPTGMRPCGDSYSARWIKRTERMKLRKQLLAIADELESQ